MLIIAQLLIACFEHFSTPFLKALTELNVENISNKLFLYSHSTRSIFHNLLVEGPSSTCFDAMRASRSAK
jgi:hypothetical protein